ncbi:MAG: hypothetical protein KR126chlam2_00557 [Chlamydiae bacterium]|nr:hypothetical protein [Chlamydiota bacterium]
MPTKKPNDDSEKLPNGDFSSLIGTDAYFSFLKKCVHLDSHYDESVLNHAGIRFAEYSGRIQQEIIQFKGTSAEYPLMAVIFLWAQWIGNDKVLGEKYLSMMEHLLERNLIQHKHPTNGKPLDIAQFSSLKPNAVIDAIRCHQAWSIEKREDYVRFYAEFSSWLSKQTFGLISEAKDRDRAITQQRKLSFETYIAILQNLEIRERIMSKIFYLGGSMGLEEVLFLKIKDINFNESSISFSGENVYFPSHVFEDLKIFLEGRKQGYVFIGRKNERINHTVPYRSLKAVVTKLGMSTRFTFKDFVKNR